jgi:hypothetical protein
MHDTALHQPDFEQEYPLSSTQIARYQRDGHILLRGVASAAEAESHDLPHSTYGALAAGDATFHTGWTMHRAPGNPTTTMREVMTIIYFADGTRLLEELHPLQEGDLMWFPGCKPGELAAGPRVPLVYKRGNATL